MSTDRPPTWALLTMMWDETGERLVHDKVGKLVREKNAIVTVDSLAAPGSLLPAASSWLSKATARTNTWQILVSRLTLMWGWGGGKGQRIVLTAPPLPLVSTSAPALWAALFHHPAMREFWAFTRDLQSKTRFSCLVGLVVCRPLMLSCKVHHLKLD